MPGVLIIEAMAQTAGAICIHKHMASDKPSLVYFMTIDNAKFRRPVVPGDRLELHVKKLKNRGNIWRLPARRSSTAPRSRKPRSPR